MPPMARGGAAFGETEIIGLPRGDCCSSDLRAVVSGHARARQSVVVQACAARSCHGAPLLSASAARRGIAPKRIQTLRFRSSRRFESRWRSVKSPRTLSQAPVFPLLPRCQPSLRRGSSFLCSSALLRLLPLLFTFGFRSNRHCFRFKRAVR